MSKNIRKIFLAAFVLTTVSVNIPNCLNPMIIRAYAEDKPSLRNIYLSEGDNIQFSEDVYSYIVDLDKDTAEAEIKAKPYDLSDTVKINGQIVNEDTNYKKNLKLEPGKNKIEIEVNDDKTKSKTLYKVYVYRGGKNAVYLNDININGKTIGFNKSTTFYNLELDEGINQIELEAIPGEGDYSITVNDVELSEKNSIKLKFKSIGNYIVKIGVKDEENDRTGLYTLNMYLGIPVSPNVSKSIDNAIKPSQWVLLYGRWRYNDALGQPLKSTWFYDSKYKGYFHFNSMGNMQTGWIKDNGNYYYLSLSGIMETGWIFDEDEWYFMGSDGAMKTGWLKDGDKWYYLRRNGGMATGWIVNNDKWYYLNCNGVMQTGWIYYGKKWYYLNEDGTMATGWIKYNNEWYYLNSNGSMKSGEWFYYDGNWYYLRYSGSMWCGWLNKDDKYYYFNEDGTLMRDSRIIDGYLYEVNGDGSLKVD